MLNTRIILGKKLQSLCIMNQWYFHVVNWLSLNSLKTHIQIQGGYAATGFIKAELLLNAQNYITSFTITAQKYEYPYILFKKWSYERNIRYPHILKNENTGCLSIMQTRYSVLTGENKYITWRGKNTPASNDNTIHKYVLCF